MEMVFAFLALSGQAEFDRASRGEEMTVRETALDETERMLVRAQKGLTPTFRDRGLAREYLDEWEDTGPDDPALRRAFERIAAGRPPVRVQLPELVRLHGNYREARAEAIARKEGRLGGGRGGRRLPVVGRIPGLRRYLKLALVAGVVFAVGIGWVLVVRRRRTARR